MAAEPGTAADGLVVRDGFLAPDVVRGLIESAGARLARGEFAEARIGPPTRLRHRPDVRGDAIRWVDRPACEAERVLLAGLEELRLELNREAYLGLFDLELHYARYPAGAGYVRHVDQPVGRGLRRVTLILYLNENWRPGDGGELRVFDSCGGHRDVEPVAGRLVYFSTAGREHAVLVTARERLSLSGWFRGREALGGT